ncbi:hypothetical protein RRG08_021241 [Elysia crispata]|uniref:Uncharacterized protein n=1 Tax=Elysia crispata TaxID=231223 RepID=A0AAE0YY12_9GAST|nr:hypothetical protein RRG08_021241 [Elysia crispata]
METYRLTEAEMETVSSRDSREQRLACSYQTLTREQEDAVIEPGSCPVVSAGWLEISSWTSFCIERRDSKTVRISFWTSQPTPTRKPPNGLVASCVPLSGHIKDGRWTEQQGPETRLTQCPSKIADSPRKRSKSQGTVSVEEKLLGRFTRMSVAVQVSVLLLLVLSRAGECNLFNFLLGPRVTPYSRGSPLDSFASHVPGSSMNTISGGPPTGSKFGPPEPPQVLSDHLGPAPPPSAAQSGSPVNNFMNMVNNLESRSKGQRSGQGQGAGQAIPVTGKLKTMVTKWATHLGHKAWYEAHGCVDPASALHGKNGRMANMAMMMGCSNPEAAQYCELSQMAIGGAQAARSRMFMELMMPKHMRDQFEQCLTPTTLMDSFTGMFGGVGGAYPHQGFVLRPPPGAAAYKHGADCSQVSPMLMMGSVGGGEGMLGPEALESIGRMRNRYLKMTCQENMLMGSLPYRLCCPGKVSPPTMQEAMMIKSMGGA